MPVQNSNNPTPRIVHGKPNTLVGIRPVDFYLMDFFNSEGESRTRLSFVTEENGETAVYVPPNPEQWVQQCQEAPLNVKKLVMKELEKDRPVEDVAVVAEVGDDTAAA